MSASLQPAFPPTSADALDERSLASAFASFTAAAGSLERSYTHLQAEVARLRHELEDTNRDLTESLAENHRMRQHLNRILEGLPCGVLVTEADGSVSIANPETRRLLGTLSETSIETLEWVPVWIQESLDNVGGGTAEREYHCSSGNLEWISIRRAQLAAAEGGSSIFILQDISEAKRLEEAQQALRRRQALAEMSALLAHEIRNPLGSLELFAELLAESAEGTERCQWAEQLQAGLRTLAATVNNVLQLHSEPQPQLVPTDLGLLLTSIGEFLRPMAKQAGVRLQVCHELSGVLVAADRHRLEQVVLNLGLNAFRFMSGGGTLKISGGVASRDVQRQENARQTALVEIEDTGSGIPAENLQLIFQPGFTTRPGSPGLGLAVCKTIMAQHGGDLAVASRPGSGTTFWLEFPLLGASQ
jgi:two-component system, sensor histidine kinase FlrB